MKKIVLMSLLLVPALFYSACQTADEELDLCVANPQEDCICYRVYDPVCGCDEQTYSNYCVAECNGIFNYTSGPCK